MVYINPLLPSTRISSSTSKFPITPRHFSPLPSDQSSSRSFSFCNPISSECFSGVLISRSGLMSLRYMTRLVAQTGARAAQGTKDHASRSVKDTAAASNTSSKRLRQLPGAVDSAANRKVCAASVAEEKRKRAEESLRTVMYLSCWGPN